MRTIRQLFAGAVLAAAGVGLAGAAAGQSLLFWSTQANPIEETQAMRDQVLAGFGGGEVEFQSSDAGPFLTRIQAELEAGEGSIAVLGTLHGDFAAMPDSLIDLSTLGLQADQVLPSLMELGQLGTDEQKYVPWMQATYIMAANREALDHLPDGADINALSYDQLIEWAANMAEASGGPKFGFPAGPEGLKHRFFQGYLLPAYTGSMVSAFRSEEAAQAWEKFRELWQYTSPASTSFNFMQEPLITGDVWVAFDHTARLAEAFNQRPDDFVAFPAPAGPAGRAFMPVIAGMAIPVTAPEPEPAMELINYMLEPETQIATLRATNFFPVMEVDLPDDVPPAVSAAGDAISAMTSAEDALPALLPVGLGDLNGQFNQVYIDTFERIILANQDIPQVLGQQAEELRRILEEASAPCWPPDQPSEGPCPVD
jgi:multiple sugar transport system substrate-binding protein